MRQRIARVTSNVLNPFLVTLAAILVVSFEATSRATDALRWSLVLLVIGMLPVLVMLLYLVRHGRLEAMFTATRPQRTGIYLLSMACAALGYLVLHLSEAPPLLRVAFASGFSGLVVFAGINLAWKISLHTGFVAALVTTLVMLYGGFAAAAAVLVPVIGWSRLALGEHTPSQTVAGALLSSAIVVAVFHISGLA